MPKKPDKNVKGIANVTAEDADFIGQRKLEVDSWLQKLAALPRIVYVLRASVASGGAGAVCRLPPHSSDADRWSSS